jgi:hypothetical protein
VAEDLALEQGLGDRGAVDRDEGLRRALAELMDGLRHHLLAGPRLAPDEDRRRGRRRLLDHAVNLADRPGAPDDPAEAAVLAQLASQDTDLAQGLLPLGCLLDEDLQPARVDRLGQVVVGAFLDRLDRGLDRTLRGEQDDRDVAHLIAQRLEQREAVHARHDDVGDDDAGTEGGDALQRFLTVGRGLGDVAPGPDQLGQPESCRPIVLDDEHALRERRWFAALRSGGFEFEHERVPLRKVCADLSLDNSVKKEVVATADRATFGSITSRNILFTCKSVWASDFCSQPPAGG